MIEHKNLVPLYIREDEQFSAVYNYVKDIFKQVQQTCSDMIENMKIDINSAEFLKLLSLFGQSSTFKQKGVKIVGLQPREGGRWSILKDGVAPAEPIDLDIQIQGVSLYYSAKFNILKNNFNGTYKALEESLSKIFNPDEDYVSVSCSQSIANDSLGVHHQLLELIIQLDPVLAEKFPPESAYLTTSTYPVWDIRAINSVWVISSPENREKYDYYKNFLDFLTLFENNYFKLNILGTITKFEISENSRALIWNDSIWNQSTWGNTTTEEE